MMGRVQPALSAAVGILRKFDGLNLLPGPASLGKDQSMAGGSRIDRQEGMFKTAQIGMLKTDH
jgi:hypothetical protein